MPKENKQVLLTALALFFVSFGAYLWTMAPTVSFWDCGEFVAAANILGIPHPPGTPFFVFLAKVFIDVMPFDDVAKRVNFISALTSALTVAVTYLFTRKALVIAFGAKALRFAVETGAVVAALLLAFSDTFWFSAVEAEVYGLAMLFVMLISLFSLLWYENRGTARGNRYLLLICYLAFLGVGVHLYTMMTIPAVFLFMVMVDRDMRFNIPLWITGILLMGVIHDIGNFLVWAGIAFVFALGGWLLSRDLLWKKRFNFCMWLSILALVGFSTHAYIPIRSALNPNIDENDPETYQAFQEFLERKQYGSESMLTRAFHRRALIGNQLLTYPHMGYGGYMLAQYLPFKVGETRADENEPVVRGKLEFPTQMNLMGTNKKLQFFLFFLFQLPLFYAAWWLYRRHKAIGVYLGLLYALGSFGLVFYMNFADGTQLELREYQYWKGTGFDPNQKPDPVHLEVRDRDYFFAPAFIFMSILFGAAAAFAVEALARKRGGRVTSGVRTAGVSMMALALAVPAFSNYKEHSRRGMFVPNDYAYNLLMSCRPNSILFTNGDNDTFPLWYMQEVEKVRRDVRVVNLSLVNTDWYIRQLKDIEPKLKVGFTDDEIRKLEPSGWPWGDSSRVLPLPNSRIVVTIQKRPYLRVQDIMVMALVRNNYPSRPVHFAVTVSDDNMMGLEKYLVMEGMVYTVVEEPKNKEVDVAVTTRLVDSVYRYRGLGDHTTFIDLNTEGLLTNYSATNFRLVSWAQERISALDQEIGRLQADSASGAAPALAEKRKERAERVAFAEKYLAQNRRLLPREWRTDYYSAQFYGFIRDYDKAEKFFRAGMENSPQPKIFATSLAQMYAEQNKLDKAEVILKDLLKESPSDFELAYGLSELYRRQDQVRKSRDVLAEWLRNNPGHQWADMVSQQVRMLDMQLSAPVAPPAAGPVPPAGAPGAVPPAGATTAPAPGAAAPAAGSNPAAPATGSGAPAPAPR